MEEARLSLDRGFECYKEGKYEEAIDWTKKSLTIYQENEDQEGPEYCYILLGTCYEQLKKYSKAINYYKQCLIIYQENEDQEGIADCYRLLGECYEKLEKYSEAIDYYEKCHAIYQENENQERIATCYELLGRCYLELKKYSEAIDYYKQGLAIYQENEDKEGILKCYLLLGGCYRELEKYSEAIVYFKQCLTICQENGDQKGIARCYMALGICYLRLEKYSEAIDYYKLCLTICPENEDQEEIANCYLLLGVCYEQLKKYSEAIEYYKLCLPIKIEKNNLGHCSWLLNRIGSALQDKGKVKEAIEYYNKYLQYAIQLNDKHDQASANNSLGAAYLDLCQHYEALGYLQTSLKLNSELGIETRNRTTYNYLRVLYGNIGNYQEAFKCLEQCINLNKKPLEANIWYNFAKVYNKLKKFELARECRLKSIIIFLREQDKKGEVWYLGELGVIFQKHKQSYKARFYHNKALKLAQEIQNSELIGTCYMILAETYGVFGQIDEATGFYERALAIFTDSGHLQNRAECSYRLACLYKCFVKQNANINITKAEKYFSEALQCYEKGFADLKEKHDLKITMLDTYIKAYKDFALLLIETGRPREALLVCDRGRACTLRDTLVSRYDMQHNQLLVDDISDRKPLEEEDLQNLLSSEKSLFFLAILEKVVHSLVLSRKHSLMHNQRRLDQDSISQDITEHIRQLIAAAHTSMNVRQMKANECEDRSLGTNETLCQEDGKLQQLTSCMSNMQLENDHDENEEEKPDISRNPPDSTLSKPQQHFHIKEPLQELFKLLIAPIEEHLKEEEEVVIVPEGILYMVPFAALQDPQTGRYFCESKRIREVPSLKTLKILKQCPPDYHSSKGALVVGNPNVGEVIFRGERTIFPSLEAAETEASVFASILKVIPLTGSSATKDAVKEKLKEGAAVIHIAAHGDDNTGEIALAPGASAQSKAIPEEEDYILTMQEVQDIGVRAKLVVLSCCHSGRGEIRAEGVIGMARAFLAGGARAVVASLWAISDQATLDFMSGFYYHLRIGESASKSLNESMKELIREKTYSHPKYWAPFVLIGDDVTIF